MTDLHRGLAGRRLLAGLRRGAVCRPPACELVAGLLIALVGWRAVAGLLPWWWLPVPLTVTSDFKSSPLAGEVPVKLKASWLVCQKECIPQEGEFTLKLPVRSTTALNSQAFEAALYNALQHF